ncbi:MAG: hypothetical protein ABS81_01450 [Pseudonocardia sp. SCN 72-86]|nr:MAG: hypothetical protein ABS81_01450 [Pseudonocardia sp. SCN 72-86]
MSLHAGPAAVTDPSELGVVEAAAALRARELSSVELTRSYLDRIDRLGGTPSFDGDPASINAYVRVDADTALAEAAAADRRRAADPDGAPPLCGVPVALKDLFAVAGRPLTASSRVLADEPVAAHDSAIWAVLRAAGMVHLGHVHTHEFMAGGTTDQVGNPWDLTRTAGGSSGGSAAAVAARLAPLSVGSDTLGSVRIPAALSGISSIKPTHGAVSLVGALKLAASLDHAGPMARTVADASMLLAAMACAGGEPTPLMPPPVALTGLPTAPRAGERPLAGTRIALTGRVDPARVEADVLAGLDAARHAAVALGAEIVELPAGPAPDVTDIEILMQAEMAVHHDPYLARMDHYRPMVRAQLEASLRDRGVVAYLAAQERRARLTAAWETWFAAHRVDALLEPTVVLTAHPRGNGYAAESVGGAEDRMTIFTALWNMTGFPVVALPSRVGTSTGLPVGVSLAAPRGHEAVVTQIGIDLQAVLGVPTPPLP